MKKLIALGIALLACASSQAYTLNYNTTGSTLSCNGVGGCTQNSSTSVTLGGITLTYNTGSGSGILLDASTFFSSNLNYGNIVTTGTGDTGALNGLSLTLNVNATPPGSSHAFPAAPFGGFGPANITTSSSLAFVNFSSTADVFTDGSGDVITFQVSPSQVFLVAPTNGNPLGQTTLEGSVNVVLAAATVPEPASVWLAAAALALLAFFTLRRRDPAAAARRPQALAFFAPR